MGPSLLCCGGLYVSISAFSPIIKSKPSNSRNYCRIKAASGRFINHGGLATTQPSLAWWYKRDHVARKSTANNQSCRPKATTAADDKGNVHVAPVCRGSLFRWNAAAAAATREFVCGGLPKARCFGRSDRLAVFRMGRAVRRRKCIG